MTLRKEFQEGAIEELDILIRVALRDSVAEAEPPPQVWGRIREQAQRWKMARQPSGQVVFDMQLMLPSLVRVSMFYPFAGGALRMY